MKKQILLGGLITAAAVFQALPASAGCVNTANTFCDGTLVQAYNGANPTNFGGPGFVPPGVGDVVQGSGNPFDTDRLNVKFTSSAGTTTLELKYYTQFNGNDLSARYADLFIGNNPGSPDSFHYGIALGDQAGNSGKSTPGFYSLASASDYETSIALWAGKSGFTYGGQYLGLDNAWHDAPTVITAPQASLVSGWSVTESEGASGDVSFPYLVDVTLMASTTDFATLFGDGMSIFWGTGDCSNDAIEAAVPVKLPEPFSLSLFGAGLAGLAAVRRRKNTR